MKQKIIISIIVLLVIGTIAYLVMPKNKKEDTINENYEQNYIVEYEEIEEYEDLLGRLEIEKIKLDAPIKEGSTDEVLKAYIGHIEETSLYDGNVGLAAHNRGNEFSYFERLNELEKGDVVTYKTPYGTRSYEVEKIEVILETDWTLLANTKDNRLTMITCISNRPTQRLCVQATQI